MKYILKTTLLLTSILLFSACQETSKSKPYLINQQESVHKKSLTHLSQEKALERKNKIDLAQIEAKSKIEMAKIESKKAVAIAQLDSVTQKDVAQKNSKTELEISKMDMQTKDKQRMINFYITIALILTLLLTLYLWYRHKKKSLEIQEKLEANRLQHEREMKEKELQEQRIQKVLDLAMSGQLPEALQNDVIKSLTQQNNKIIEAKPKE